MAKSRRSYKGAPVSNTISGSLSAGATSITLSSAMSGWPTSSAPFFAVVEPGTAREEKICVIYSNSTTLTVVDPAVTSGWSASANGRGVDDTTDRNHDSGSAIYPVFTAREANEANELTSSYAHQGSLVHQGSTTFTELQIGTAGQILKVNSGATAPEWGQVPTAGIADSAVTEAKLAADAVTAGKIAAGAVDSSELASSSVTLAKLATAVQNFLVPVGTIAMYGGATAPTGWLLCDGSGFSPSSYPTLNTVLGGTNTPDLKGRFAIGDNSTLTLLASGGSATIAEANLPAHKHAVSLTTASSTTGVTTQSAGAHTHSTDEVFVLGTHYSATAGGSLIDPGAGATGSGGAHTHAITDPGHTHTVTGDTATTGSGTAYYPPYVVVNYIIKHD